MGGEMYAFFGISYLHDWSIPRLITTMGTGEFQDVPMRGDITKPFEGRSRHTAVVVKNPKGGSSIYVFGGVHEFWSNNIPYIF